MELVNITQLQPGQVLASAVTNAGGAVLCPMGFKLTEDSIRRLKNAGVEAVIVESNDVKSALIDERITALKERFQDVDDPIMLQLSATIEKRLNVMRF